MFLGTSNCWQWKRPFQMVFQVLHETGVSTRASFHLATAQDYMNCDTVGCNPIFQNVIVNSEDKKTCGIMCSRGLGPQNCQFWGPMITAVIFEIQNQSILSLHSFKYLISAQSRLQIWVLDTCATWQSYKFVCSAVLCRPFTRLHVLQENAPMSTQARMDFDFPNTMSAVLLGGSWGLQPIIFSSNYRIWGIGTEKGTIPKKSVVGHTWIFIRRIISAYL